MPVCERQHSELHMVRKCVNVISWKWLFFLSQCMCLSNVTIQNCYIGGNTFSPATALSISVYTMWFVAHKLQHTTHFVHMHTSRSSSEVKMFWQLDWTESFLPLQQAASRSTTLSKTSKRGSSSADAVTMCKLIHREKDTKIQCTFRWLLLLQSLLLTRINSMHSE